MSKETNIQMLEETLRIFRQGKYRKDDRTVKTNFTLSQCEACAVFLPEHVREISQRKISPRHFVLGSTGVACRNIDSFSMARAQLRNRFLFQKKGAKPPLVLNFANPVHPGGGVWLGARAQEEDLCRKSSLLLSLESKKAMQYYAYNRLHGGYLASDAIILSPEVMIIRDENGDLLDEPVTVAVMTCAAPMVTRGKQGLTEDAYQQLFYNRICGMLKLAAYYGYRVLVLGAFGCGAFGNDARVVSDLFYRALKDFKFDEMPLSSFFDRIDFAVLDSSPEQYNYKEFMRNFSDFYRDEKAAKVARAEQKKRENEKYLGPIRGCLFGGAVGDALGYPVEFLSEQAIFERYGAAGITHYELDPGSGKALISDDTQMTLFTANGLLVGDTRGCMRGIQGNPRGYVAIAYQDWLHTQLGKRPEDKQFSWLCDVPELHARRAPGNTCLSALSSNEGKRIDDYIANPRNNSKGCGGVMRIAPLALNYQVTVEHLDKEAAQLAAITHGHSLGYMPAAVLCHIINRIVFPGETKMTLRQIVTEAKETCSRIFAGDAHLKELTELIDRAIVLSENGADDLQNIRALGEGWVAEETLAIAIYCSLKYADDFSKGVIAAVNHSGDSDSTGAVTGNILGALLGYDAIAQQWKTDLECADVILEIADDICHGCQMDEYSSYCDVAWQTKYMYMRRYIPAPEDEEPAVKDLHRGNAIDSLNWFLRNGGM